MWVPELARFLFVCLYGDRAVQTVLSLCGRLLVLASQLIDGLCVACFGQSTGACTLWRGQRQRSVLRTVEVSVLVADLGGSVALMLCALLTSFLCLRAIWWLLSRSWCLLAHWVYAVSVLPC